MHIKFNTILMRHNATTLLCLLAVVLFSSCSRGWSVGEKELIREGNSGIMRVTTIDNKTDSLLLRTASQPLTRREVGSKEFDMLAASLLATVNNPTNSGVGIAAPQVGILRRVVAVQRFDKEGEPFEIYVNPEITSYGPEVTIGGEGCLSIPSLRGEVKRATSIEISWRDEKFKQHRESIDGFTAVIFQHEIDHLDGILYTDRAASVCRE